MRKIVVFLLVATVVLAGCTPLERSAYNTIVAAKAFLDSEKAQHPECSTVPGSEVCTDLVKATASKDLLISALEVYCAGPQFETGGACNAPTKGTAAYDQAAAKLQAAIASYNQVAADLKKATGGK
jgi:hypothetical protein